jgi:hypothetical protein
MFRFYCTPHALNCSCNTLHAGAGSWRAAGARPTRSARQDHEYEAKKTRLWRNASSICDLLCISRSGLFLGDQSSRGPRRGAVEAIFPCAERGENIEAPISPGIYEARYAGTGMPDSFDAVDNVAQVMSRRHGPRRCCRPPRNHGWRYEPPNLSEAGDCLSPCRSNDFESRF